MTWEQLSKLMTPGERYTTARLMRLTGWDRGRVADALNGAYAHRQVERGARARGVAGMPREYWRTP